MGCSVLTLRDKKLWHEKLAQIGISDFYFSPEYAQLCGFIDEGESCCFLFEDGDKTFIYPFRKRKLPSYIKLGEECFDISSDYGYGGPLSNCNDSAFMDSASHCFRAFCKESKIIAEFVRFHPLLNNHDIVKNYYDVIPLNETVIVKIGCHEDMLKGFRKGHKSDIIKCRKNGVTFRFAQAKTDWIEFKTIYEDTMKHLSASSYYFFSEDYFEFLRSLKDNIFVLLAEHSSQIIGAACFFWDANALHYHLAGMKREFAWFGVNKSILFEAFKIAYEKGVKLAHLGGGVGGSDFDSLMDFKAGFSNLRSRFHIAKRVLNEDKYLSICDSLKIPNPLSGYFPGYRNPSLNSK